MQNLTTAVSAIWWHMEKILYRWTSTFSALNCCGGILFKCLSYLYEVGAQTFAPIFRLFTIFDHNFVKIVAWPNDDNNNSLAHLRGQSLPQKNGEKAYKSTYKPWHNTRSNYVPRAHADKVWQKNTTFSHLYQAHIVSSRPNFARW